MKKYLLLLVHIFFFINITFSQNEIKNIYFEKNNNHLKFYLKEDFNISCEQKGKYYCNLNLDKTYFIITDSIKVFYANTNRIHLKGNFVNGKKHGEFIWYYPDGKIEKIGSYNQDIRDGSWKSYYQNGQIRKEIIYTNNSCFLKDFYLETGEQLVYNGEGSFIDFVPIYGLTNNIPRIKGNVKNGVMDGKWDIYIQGNLISTEFFENKSFIKGISYSKALGNSEYYEINYSTFSEVSFIENLNFKPPNYCDIRKGSMINSRDCFYKYFIPAYNKTSLSKKITEGWFFAVLDYNNSGKIIDIKIISNQDEEVNKEFVEIIKKNNKECKNLNNTQLIVLAITNNEIYGPFDNNLTLFNSIFK